MHYLIVYRPATGEIVNVATHDKPFTPERRTEIVAELRKDPVRLALPEGALPPPEGAPESEELPKGLTGELAMLAVRTERPITPNGWCVEAGKLVKKEDEIIYE